MTSRQSLERLVDAVQELSLARDLDAVAAAVRSAARALVEADGATFVLREDSNCYYVDEDAISPLWKGQRFPQAACISGWSMLHRRPAVIEDIYQDPRIPHEAYRPTFVRSLVMVPIRTRDPIGAIGTYWAQPHRASDAEVRLLQALSDSTSVALENVRVYAELEQRVRERTRQLGESNRRLEEEVAERRRAQAEVERLSQTDALTGLLNRRGFFTLAEAQYRAACSRESRCLIVFVDVDGLKQCNDQAGHAAGDALIRRAACVLAATFRRSDVLARMGGDEFVALIADDHDDATAVRARLEAALRTHNAAHPHERPLALSAGVVEAKSGEGLDRLIAEADRAMYREKCRRRQTPLATLAGPVGRGPRSGASAPPHEHPGRIAAGAVPAHPGSAGASLSTGYSPAGTSSSNTPPSTTR